LPNYPYCGDKLCAAPCTDSSCPPDAACGKDGACTLTLCDAPGSEPCPELWRCDPPAAAIARALNDQLVGTTVAEAPLEADRYFARGCMRKRCDEPGGYECAAAWSCKPDLNTHPVGCVPDECRETGSCADDTTLVCLSDAKHADHGPLDVNGCVPRTCDDGFSCARITEAGVDVGRCQYGAPSSDYYGCVVLPCTSDDECFYGYRCDPLSPQADQRGCRLPSCTEGYTCPDGFVCDPTAAERDAADCTIPEPANTGGTGMGGSAGTAAGGTGTSGLGGSSGGSAPRVGGAGGTGGTGSGGSVGTAPPRGQCVAR
jgi:hypothetical protein